MQTQNKEKDSPFISDEIGETLLITLYMKAIQSKEKEPIIYDKEALRLVRAIDYDFDKFKKATTTSVGVAIRARYFDEMLTAFIQQRKNPVIVLLGCGLDSRYQRIGEHAQKATFYQLDIPEVMNIRKQYLPPQENETYIAASMFDERWIDKVKDENPSGDFLFIIEGVLMYFDKAKIKGLFERIAHNFSHSEMLFDVAGVWMSKNSHRQDSVKLVRANFDYGTDDDREMETWANNLQLLSTKYYSDFGKWKNLGIKGFIMRIIPRFRKAGRMLHYKINGSM